MPTTLLKTKLYIPPAPPRLVARPRLIRQLNQGLHRKLTLVSAPPGFGKTTLLSEWIHQTGNGRDISAGSVAWVSLDEQDNDPVRFWTYVITALDTVQADLGADAMTLLQEPQSPPIEEILTALINAAAEVSHTFALMLDDYHVIETESIHHALAFLLEHMPPQMHLALTSRSDPPLPLTRLRVRNQLTELRDSDLRFTLNEAAVFLNNAMGLDLSPEDLTALESRTEGWIAGLQLAALSMQGRDDAQSFVRAFTGSHRYIIDYLAEEILARQPKPIKTFLLHTSILDRLCGPLCDVVVDSTLPPNGQLESMDSQAILEYLEGANLFLIPLDDERRWYRYHHLFADFLRETLDQTVDAATVADLNQQASRWYARHNLIAEAVSHALAAGDNNRAVELIEQVTVTVLTSGEVNTFLGWLEALPTGLTQQRPRLGLGQGWAMVILNRWADVEPLLQQAEAGLEGLDPTDPERSQGWSQTDIESMWGEAAAMRAMMMGNRGQPAEAAQLCKQALEKLPKQNSAVRSIVMLVLGGAYEALGEFERASQVLTETVSISQPDTNLVMPLTALSSLGRLYEEQGNLHRAAEYYRQGLQLVEQQNKRRSRPFPATRWAHIELAELYREWNELEQAKHHLTIALEMKHQLNMLGGGLAVAQLILARILQAQSDIDGALESVRQARQLLYRPSPLTQWIDAVEARLWLAQGNLPAAGQWAERCDLPGKFQFSMAHYPHYITMPGEYATLARVYIAQEKFDTALALLAQLKAAARRESRRGRLLEFLVVEALACLGQSDAEQALELLVEALSIGEAGGYVRAFADEGEPMAQLLWLAKARGLAGVAYLDRLLNASASPQAGGPLKTKATPQPPPPNLEHLLIEPLSDREMEVLQLVAEGLSNREIGERLFITVGTAKTHTINIYRKLDVNSRTQAVARAQELGLL